MNQKWLLLFNVFMCLCLLLGNNKLSGQPVRLDWARHLGGKLEENVRGLVTDAAGNVYITGGFRDTADFDPGPGTYNLVAQGSMDIFVAKLNAAGQLVWAIQVGSGATGTSIEMGSTITLDPFGHVLIGGSFADVADFDPGPGVFNLTSNGGQSDAFVLKLDTAGNFKWAVSIGNTGADGTRGIVSDTAGNVYVTGRFDGTVDFDPGTPQFFLSAAVSTDAFVLKLDSAGKFVWATQYNTTGLSAEGLDILLDNEGHVYVGGGGTIVPGTSSGGFIWKLDNSGTPLWTYIINGIFNDHTQGIAFDPAGYVYAVGWFADVVDFDQGAGQALLTCVGVRDMYVLKVDTAGNFVWVKGVGAARTDEARGISLDSRGNVFVTGAFNDTVDFDPGPGVANLVSNGGNDPFILKLDSAGNYQWAFSVGSVAGTEWGQNVTIDAHGTVHFLGNFHNTIDAEPGAGVTNLVSNGGSDVFLIKLVCNDTTTGTFTDSACVEYTLLGETFTESGIYTLRTPNAAGCDSIITFHLTIPFLEPVINVDGLVLGTAADYSSYQWLLNGIVIPGATGAKYTVKENGDYTVEVTNEMGCKGLSSVYKVTNVPVGINAPVVLTELKVYPNPASEQITIANPTDARFLNIAIVNVLGQVIQNLPVQPVRVQQIDIRQLPAGYYLLRLQTEQGVVVRPLEIL